MRIKQIWTRWNSQITALFRAEIPMSPSPRRLAEAGSLMDSAEQAEETSCLSVALMQMGLIGHLPEAFPTRFSRS